MGEASARQIDGEASAKLTGEQTIVSEKLCASIGLPAKARVLDIGTAMGHSALHASIAAGRRRAKVVGIHMREAVLEKARERARVEALDDVEFIAAEATEMPFEDASFDYVLSTLGVVFLPDQEAAAREVARVVKPGGVIALTAFTRLSLPAQVYDLFPTIIPNLKRPPRHHYEWADGPRASALLSPYFHNVQVQLDSYDSCFPSLEAAFDMTSQWNPNMQNLLSKSPPEVGRQVRDGYIKIAESINQATDGTFMGRTHYGIITGVRKG